MLKGSSKVYKFFDEKASGGTFKNEDIPNKELAKELHKAIIRKFKESKAHTFQGRRKLFNDGWLSKNVDRHGWPTLKNWKKKKKRWLKRPKAVSQKTKFGPKYKWFKNSYLKLFFWIFIFIHKVQWTSSEIFFNFKFFSRKSQSQQKLPKKIFHFTIQFRSKTSLILWISTHLTLKIIRFDNTAKNLSEFTKSFPVNMFLFGVRKNICTPPFLNAQNCIPEALWKPMSVYFCIYT